MTLFYRFMPDLIYEGHIYIAMPPLYKVMPARGKEEYLYDDKALKSTEKHIKEALRFSGIKDYVKWTQNSFGRQRLNPNTRILKRVEIEDARIASDVTEMLMGNDVPPRKAFIYEHANDAELDI